MKERRAVVLGATGLVGRHCLERLLLEPRYAGVVTLGRRELEVRGPRHQHHRVDFDRPETLARFLDVDDLFCCLGTTMKKAGSQAAFRKVDFDYPLAAADIASRRVGAQLMLVSSAGADARSPIFYNRVKGELEGAVSALPFRAVHIFRPSLLLGDREEFRLGEKIARTLAPALMPMFVGSIRRYRPIKAEQVAQAMITMALRGNPGVHVYESDVIVASQT